MVELFGHILMFCAMIVLVIFLTGYIIVTWFIDLINKNVVNKK